MRSFVSVAAITFLALPVAAADPTAAQIEAANKEIVGVWNDRLYGWYSSTEHELPATKLTKTGDEVVMSMTAKTRDGQPVDVTFRGTAAGDRVSGKADYDLDGETGSFPFTGRRKS